VRAVAGWPVDNAAVAVVAASGDVLGAEGPQEREFRLASVTKMLTAYATLVAVEEGAVEWDQPAGPEGSTVRHLIAHVSGLAFDEHKVMAAPGTRRMYSNAGFEVLADAVHDASGIPFAEYLTEAVLAPLGMESSRLAGGAGSGAVSTCADLTRFAAVPGLAGVLPGYGYQKENDWGLGFELRAHKSPHWTGKGSSPATFGHFGQSGTFLWVDPDVGAACVALSDRAFGQWAIDAWPDLTDAVLAEL
jgi:CubicO group peptidase (beta-lactamase class C family)